MPEDGTDALLNTEMWNATPEEVLHELESFIDEFGSFNPEWFTEVKFHLLRHVGLNQESRDELCELAIHHAMCPKCNLLYTAKRCLLWYRLFRIIRWPLVERAPPCIRMAYAKKNIRTVARYLTKANVITPPFLRVRSAPSCKSMRKWGYCHPDSYCRAMERENTLSYIPARERLKLAGTAHSHDGE